VRYSLTFREEQYAALIDHLLGDTSVERAAYLLCRVSRAASETRLIVREILPVPSEEVIEASRIHMKIPSTSFMRAMKRADLSRQSFVFVHSHPGGFETHSDQDDSEERELFRTAYNRISVPGPHASMVISAFDKPRARIWCEDGGVVAAPRVRVIGSRFRFFDSEAGIEPMPAFFDRQVRAFGPEIQRLLQRLTVGVVGAGGTGSAVFEELVRLGVGTIIILDGQAFESSNVNRVYGSRVIDDGMPKVKIAERLAANIGLATKIKPVPQHITVETAAQELRECDVVFGCTDDEWGRSILTRLATYYVIPVFDMGVKIDSDGERIAAIEGRVTTLMPGTACLFCRERIDGERIRAESLSATNPAEADELRREGYIPALATPAPAVIPFTTTIAAAAVAEMLHRLTGCFGDERTSTEIIHQFHNTVIRTNSRAPREECLCTDPTRIGRADSEPFLDLTWRDSHV
jgi:molybdopterin/thiamine biosynthesis adenylyltransferase